MIILQTHQVGGLTHLNQFINLIIKNILKPPLAGGFTFYTIMRNILFLFTIGILSFTFNSCDEEDPKVELPSLTIDPISIDEGNDQKVYYLNLRLSEKPIDTVHIYLNSIDGSAKGGEDFISFQAEYLSISPNQQSGSFKFTVIGDEEQEEDETFTVDVDDIINAEYTSGPVTVTILNDDYDNELYIPETGYSTPLSYPGMSLIWQDEFEGNQVDLSNWKFETGGEWSNNELQYYKKENTSIVDGHLVIEARNEAYGGHQYTSSRMITHDKFDFQYGRVDIRAALPYGKGLWPALWMLGEDIYTTGWPACGEIDIMELVGGTGSDNQVHGTAHWSNSGQHASAGGHYALSQGIFYDEFHVFSLEWSATQLKWYVNDIHYYTLDITSSGLSELRDHPFFFIFNVAVGGDWPGNPTSTTVFPQRMIVDYIRVFQ